MYYYSRSFPERKVQWVFFHPSSANGQSGLQEDRTKRMHVRQQQVKLLCAGTAPIRDLDNCDKLGLVGARLKPVATENIILKKSPRVPQVPYTARTKY